MRPLCPSSLPRDSRALTGRRESLFGFTAESTEKRSVLSMININIIIIIIECCIINNIIVD